MTAKTKNFNLFNRLKTEQSHSTDGDFETIGDLPSRRARLDFAPSSGIALASSAMVASMTRAAFDIPGPVKAVAAMSAKSGVAGGIVDAAVGGIGAIKPLSEGKIDLKQAGIHVVSEGVCGFLTASAGTAGSVSAYMLTGSLGPIVIASGMASSMAVRWGYRSVVGETLPNENDKKQKNSKDSSKKGSFEDIGKK